ncbi:MAG: YtxH domain-containing protein [Elusimicrobiota bacterium]
MAEQDSGESSILAFLLGGVAGAAIGLLLAPTKGEETRKRVIDWLEEGQEKAKRFLDGEKEVLKHKGEQLGAAWEAGKKAYGESNGPDAD